MRFSPLASFCAAISLAFITASRAADPAPIPIEGLKGNIHAARWTPDGKTLVVAGAQGLFIVDPTTAKVTRVDEMKTSLESLALSPDGTLAAVGQRDGNIVLYKVADGTAQTTIPAKEFSAGDAPSLAGFMPDGRSLVGGGKAGCIWNVADGKLVKNIAFPQPLQIMALSPDGKLLVACSRHGGGFSVYDVGTGSLAKQQPEVKKSTPQEFNPNPAMIDVIGFTPDNARFYAGSFITAGLYFYNANDGKQTGRLKLDGFQKGSFNKDGSKLAWGSWNTQAGAKNAITITDTKTGATLQQIPSASLTLFSALSPDASTLFVLPQSGGGAVLYKLGTPARR